MALRTASRVGIDTSLRVARLPLDLTASVIGGRESGLGLAVDRTDARLRSLAGALLGDAELQQDAARRHAATDERVRALRLRENAEEVDERAEERVAERERAARQRRADAARTAEQRKEEAERQRREREQRAQRAAEKRSRAAQRERAAAQREARERADESRLKALEEKAEALEEEEEALVAADEAQRLARAAGTAKERRKRNGAR